MLSVACGGASRRLTSNGLAVILHPLLEQGGPGRHLRELAKALSFNQKTIKRKRESRESRGDLSSLCHQRTQAEA